MCAYKERLKATTNVRIFDKKSIQFFHDRFIKPMHRI